MRDAIKRWQLFNGDPKTGNAYKNVFVLISEHPDRVMHPLAWNRIMLLPGAFVDLPHLHYAAYFAAGMEPAPDVRFQINSGRCRGARSLAESARINREHVREAEACQKKKGLL